MALSKKMDLALHHKDGQSRKFDFASILFEAGKMRMILYNSGSTNYLATSQKKFETTLGLHKLLAHASQVATSY